jgi:hemerythrin
VTEEYHNFTWKTEYEIGIPILDAQHKELFKRIDGLLFAIYDSKEKEELSRLGKFMIEYIEMHFSDEEELMLESHYPDYQNHKLDHNDFITLYHSFQDEITNRGPSIFLANRMLKELSKWWENHILKADMLFKPYVRKINY